MCDYGLFNRIGVMIGIACVIGGLTVASASGALAFSAGQNGEYTFDTGLVRGTLCGGGRSSGLTSVVHIPSGTRLDGGSGIFGFYRLLATDHRYGRMGWDIPGRSRLLSDGAVEITLPAADDRPFELSAVYRWTGPATMDLTATIKPRADLSNFELFLASYFNDAVPSPYVYAQTDSGPGEFLLAEKSYGDWMTFPRDKAWLPMIRDGRWQKEPYPINWAIVREYALPLAVRRGDAQKPAVVLMAPREDCVAISMPYEGESHYSLYLSLFGRDVKAGQSATAHARFVVTTDASDREILDLYQTYRKQRDAEK